MIVGSGETSKSDVELFFILFYFILNFEWWGSQGEFVNHFWIAEKTFNLRSFEQTGLFDLKLFLTEPHLKVYVLLLRNFDACDWYVLIKLVVMMDILRFVQLWPGVTWLVYSSLPKGEEEEKEE